MTTEKPANSAPIFIKTTAYFRIPAKLARQHDWVLRKYRNDKYEVNINDDEREIIFKLKQKAKK